MARLSAVSTRQTELKQHLCLPNKHKQLPQSSTALNTLWRVHVIHQVALDAPHQALCHLWEQIQVQPEPDSAERNQTAALLNATTRTQPRVYL